MLKGLFLTLMIGPLVPVPVPQSVLDDLVSVEVTTRDDGPSAFQLRFTLHTTSPLHTLFLLAGGGIVPLMRTLIVATVNGTPQVLMDGVITHQQVTPGQDAGHSTLTVTGEDLTAMMNQQDFSGLPFPAMPVEARVELILLKYVVLGVVPLVVPTFAPDVPLPTDRIPVQQGTDLAYVQGLARDAGYVFYIDPGPVPGASVAYWGPQIKVGVPQPALNVNMDAFTNVESLQFSFDAQSKTLPVVIIQNEETNVPIPIPVPDISPLNPPLGLIPPLPRITFQTDTAKMSPQQALVSAIAEASRTADAVTGNGTLDVLRYGRVLKARGLVGVRGVGPAFDGLYYVKGVTHTIQRGQYKQSFQLTRNGLLSTVPLVAP